MTIADAYCEIGLCPTIGYRLPGLTARVKTEQPNAFSLPSLGSAVGSIGSGLSSLFAGGGLPFGLYIVAAILAAFAGFWIIDSERIAGLNGQIADLHCQIDGPTETPKCTQNGFRAQLSRANNNLATAHSNIDELTKDVAGEKSQIDKLATDTQAAVKRAQALQGQLRAAESKAASVAALLNAQRPAQPSYAALTGLIKQKAAP